MSLWKNRPTLPFVQSGRPIKYRWMTLFILIRRPVGVMTEYTFCMPGVPGSNPRQVNNFSITFQSAHFKVCPDPVLLLIK